MCAKRVEKRIASPKDVVEMFIKLGYPPPERSSTEFAAEEEPSESGSVQDILSDVCGKKTNDATAFNTKDVELQDFIRDLKRRRRRKTTMLCVAMAIAMLAIIGIISWLCLR